MSHNTFHLFTDPWEASIENFSRDNNVYVCLSGNSAVGKSTLVKVVGKHLFRQDSRTIAIDEKSIHHPFLSSLFLEAEQFAFQVQLNFMVQRSLLVKKWLLSGYNLVMERSHFEDRIFMEHLFHEGFVSEKEYNSYLKLWECIAQRIPKPMVMVFVDIPPEESLKRLSLDELVGARPREYPNDKTKRHWLNSWFKLYARFFNGIKNEEPDIKVIHYNKQSNVNELLSELTEYLEMHRKLRC